MIKKVKSVKEKTIEIIIILRNKKTKKLSNYIVFIEFLHVMLSIISHIII